MCACECEGGECKCRCKCKCKCRRKRESEGIQAGRMRAGMCCAKRVESEKDGGGGVCMGEEGDMRDMDLQSDAQRRCSGLRSRDAGRGGKGG